MDVVKKDVALDITNNLTEFRKTTMFQQSILTYIISLNERFSDLEELRNLFISLDTT